MLSLTERLEDIRHECETRGWQLETYLAMCLRDAIKEKLQHEPILIFVPVVQAIDVMVEAG